MPDVTKFLCAAVIATVLASRPVHGQVLPPIPPAPTTPYELGCQGDVIQGTLDLAQGWLASYPVVTRVLPGSPAEVAGIQVGDEEVFRDGVDQMKPPLRPRRFAPGDTIWLGLRRAGVMRDVVLVIGKWVNDGPQGERVCHAVQSASAKRP